MLLALAELLEMAALLLQVLFEAGLMLPLDLCVVRGAVERVILMSAGGTEGGGACRGRGCGIII